MSISEATMNKLKRAAEAEEPVDVLFPDEAKEILKELGVLALHLIGEASASLIMHHLTKPSMTCTQVCSSLPEASK